LAALSTLVENGHLNRQILHEAIAQYEIDVERAAPWTL
jgi:pyruvate dehydrogenase complex dehydrogenase (E1) component